MRIDDEKQNEDYKMQGIFISMEGPDGSGKSTQIELLKAYLKKKGYDEINQLVGYIMSGDPGYISSHNDARAKITGIERSTIVEVLLRNYISKL